MLPIRCNHPPCKKMEVRALAHDARSGTNPKAYTKSLAV